MKDYSANEFDRKTFILNYEVNPQDNVIVVNYADKTNEEIPYSTRAEKVLLEKMKKQVLNHHKEYEKAKKELKECTNKKKLALIVATIVLGMALSSFSLGFLNGIIALVYDGIILKMMLKVLGFKQNNVKIRKKLSLIEDYEKNLSFVENEEVFSNKRIMKPDVLSNVTLPVLIAINEKITTKTLSMPNDIVIDDGYVPLADYALIPDINTITDEEYKSQLESVEKEHIENGYIDYAEDDEPLLDINEIDSLSYDDVYNTYQLSNKHQNTKGRVLTKVISCPKG